MDSRSLIEGFINEHVTRQGLDYRTEKAYRLDLEHFCTWIQQIYKENSNSDTEFCHNIESKRNSLEDLMEIYLDYLAIERNLCSSTICRKNRVFGYYLSYLTKQGILGSYRSLKPVKKENKVSTHRSLLSKKESDAFFSAMEQEYKELDSDFRKRICLRDMVMMELLFYHKIEISELLRMEVTDYNSKAGTLAIRRKRGESRCLYLFSEKLRQKMDEWLKERNAFRCEGEYYNRMFLSKFGKALSMKMMIKIFHKYKEMAGIQKQVTPKDLKDSCMKQYARELVIEMCG